MNTRAGVWLITLMALAVCVPACLPSRGVPAPADENRAAALTPLAAPTMADTAPRDYPGIHNAVAFHAGFVSGSQPEGGQGLRSLAAMGIKTIISVDGAEPDVELARSLGMRYIHLPIGYNGFDDDRRLELTRATRDALAIGPVYIHCHHGKHRSAGAAAAVAAGLGWMTGEQGVARMKVSGTAPHYTGLYSCALHAQRVTEEELDAVDPDFPEISKPSSFVQSMVDTDHAFEHLKMIEKAGWTTPADHPDLVPAAEAGRLADLYRAMLEMPYTHRRAAGTDGPGFVSLLRESQAQAQRLEDLLAAGGGPDRAALTAQFRLVSASCKDCHARFRD